MRWNTGGSYPAIEQSVPGEVLIPFSDFDEINHIGKSLLETVEQLEDVKQLIESVNEDIAKIIEGSLDTIKLLSDNEATEEWLKNNSSPLADRENF